MSKVHLTANITAKPEAADQVEKALLAVVPTVRAEAGCLRYDLHRASRESSEFLFYEIWAGPEALKAHGQSAHMNAMRESIKDLVEGPTQIVFWDAVDCREG